MTSTYAVDNRNEFLIKIHGNFLLRFSNPV